jgi:hypothetical protein
MTTATHLPQLPARTMRHGDAGQLVAMLELHQRQKLDLVMPLPDLTSELGLIKISGRDPVLGDDGVTDVNGAYRFTDMADRQLSQILDIPRRYYNKTHEQAVLLFDDNFNHWARHESPEKRVLVRTMYGQDPDYPGTAGIIRAVLSDKYGIRDHLDTVLAGLDGMREAGLAADNIVDCRLSDDRMYVYVDAPEISVMAPELLKGYRSPYGDGHGTGHGGTDAETLPVISAGLVFTNSETGWGATTVKPRLTVRICNNGLTMTRTGEGIRQVHRGMQLDEGQIEYKADTRDAMNTVVTKQMRDAISEWLTKDYVQAAVDRLTENAGVELTTPSETIEVVAKQLSYTEGEKNGILSHFIKGGQLTSGGVMQAVTSWAQEINNVDRAQTFEETGIEAMMIAARHQLATV